MCLQEAKPVEKTEFNVKLESFDPAQKVALIRAIKDLVKDLNLIAVQTNFMKSLFLLKLVSVKLIGKEVCRGGSQDCQGGN